MRQPCKLSIATMPENWPVDRQRARESEEEIHSNKVIHLDRQDFRSRAFEGVVAIAGVDGEDGLICGERHSTLEDSRLAYCHRFVEG